MVKPMKQPTQNKGSISLKELVFFGVYAALMIAFKELMGVLPNIEPITVMVIALTCVYGIKALLPVYVFSIIQIVLHGFHVWNFMYLYVWAVLVFLTLLLLPIHRLLGKLGGSRSAVLQTALWTVVAALFGIVFGTLCAIPYFFMLGTAGGVSWIISGLSFDITHCIANGIITAAAFYPLYKALNFAKLKLI